MMDYKAVTCVLEWDAVDMWLLLGCWSGFWHCVALGLEKECMLMVQMGFMCSDRFCLGLLSCSLWVLMYVMLQFFGCIHFYVLQDLQRVLAALIVTEVVVWFGVFDHEFLFSLLFILLNSFWSVQNRMDVKVYLDVPPCNCVSFLLEMGGLDLWALICEMSWLSLLITVSAVSIVTLQKMHWKQLSVFAWWYGINLCSRVCFDWDWLASLFCYHL